MEFRHLRFFIAVAEELHFTRAATRLRVAQPHLSQEIRRLEDELGVALLVRDRRHVELTAAGRAFLAEARIVLAASAGAARAAQRAARGEIGQVRIGFASSAGFGLLPDAVRRFRQQWPGVELSLQELNSNEQVDMLRSGRLDVGLFHPPEVSEPGLAFEVLIHDPLIVAMPEGHRLASRARIPIAALAAEPWILFPRHVASRLFDEIHRACAEAGFIPRAAQEAVKLSTIISLIASGLGIGLVPMPLARLRLWRTVCRPLAAPGPQVPLALGWRIGDPNPALEPVLATIREEAQAFARRGGWEAAVLRPPRAARSRMSARGPRRDRMAAKPQESDADRR
jgi:DNA-binding transcriptional LysR family regulator